jgi:hypothetical protein
LFLHLLEENYTTCPICEKGDYMSTDEWYDFLETQSDEFRNDYNCNKTFNLLFCSSCKIVFDNGCVHGCNGCSDGVTNGHLIRK